jgi:LacI family transcriptional regulator
MSIKAPSIKDIAKKANVSITTVSFIVNGKGIEKNISTAVIARVEKIIQEDGYKPNQVARSLRMGTSKIIGLIVEDISNPFFAGIARLIEDKAYKKGYKIIYSSTENQPGKTKELINLFKSRQVDAYIIAPSEGSEPDIERLLLENKPVVLFDRYLPALNVNYVGIDNLQASYAAVKQFLKEKRVNIALITVDLDIEQINDRLEGYKQALLDHNLPFRSELVIKMPFDQSRDETVNQLMGLFKSNPELDAVLFATNYLAISGLLALKQMNKMVDDRFSVIAYDDGDVFKLHTPQISAVAQPLDEISDNIIDLIFSQISSKESLPAQKIILSGKLILR